MLDHKDVQKIILLKTNFVEMSDAQKLDTIEQFKKAAIFLNENFTDHIKIKEPKTKINKQHKGEK